MIHEEMDLTDDSDAKAMVSEIYQGTTTARTMDLLSNLYPNADVTVSRLSMMLTQVTFLFCVVSQVLIIF